MLKRPELLLRSVIFEDFSESAIQVRISDLEEALKSWPGVWWNAYSQKYGVQIKEFPYEARNGFFIDTMDRKATHRFTSSGIVRRDLIFQETAYTQIVLEEYRKTWFDIEDAIRTYAVLITSVDLLNNPISVEKFGLFNSWGHVSPTDPFHRPRLIKASWRGSGENNNS